MILNYTVKGDGPPILLIHGMAASLRYWEAYMEELAKNHKVIAIDLLGFGHSPTPKIGYTPEDHVKAIQETLQSLKIAGSMTVVAHSMGALIALRYATIYPTLVSKLILIGMPIYKSPGEAKADITRSKSSLRFTYYGRTSQILCTTWCRLLRPVTKHLAPLYLPKLPKHVAQDSLLHTWNAYSQSLHEVIENQHVEKDLNQLSMPINLIYGDSESKLAQANLADIKLGPNMKKIVLPGTHSLPLERVEELSKIILA